MRLRIGPLICLLAGFAIVLAIVINDRTGRERGRALTQDWARIVELKLYDVDAFTGRVRGVVDASSAFEVDATTIELLANNVEPCGKQIWKGCFSGDAKMPDGQQIRVAFSYYGAFFYVLDWNQTFRFTGTARPEFESLREKAFRETFHPQRSNKSRRAQTATPR
jgi:hypothetical protein